MIRLDATTHSGIRIILIDVVNDDLTSVLTGPASFTGRWFIADIHQVGIVPQPADQMHLLGDYLVCKWSF